MMNYKSASIKSGVSRNTRQIELTAQCFSQGSAPSLYNPPKDPIRNFTQVLLVPTRPIETVITIGSV